MTTYEYNPVLTGSVDNDGTGDTIRAAFTKTNAMLEQIMKTTGAVSLVEANKFLASPTTGASDFPAFRVLSVSDLPVSGVVAGTYGNLTINNNGLVIGATVNMSYCKGFRNFNQIYWFSTTQIVIPIGTRARDAANTVDMSVSTSLLVSIAGAGANGLDTGAAAADNWYYVYLIAKADGTVAGLLSLVDESSTGAITLPATYIYKRQLPTVIRYNAASVISQFTQSGNFVALDTTELVSSGTTFVTSATQGWLFTVGATVHVATISTSLLVPPIADVIILASHRSTASTTSIVADTTLLSFKALPFLSSANCELTITNPAHALRIVQAAANSTTLWIRGFYITKTIP